MPRMRGMAASRKGRPVIGLQTLIDRLTKRASEVSVEDAEQAAQVFSRGRGRAQRYRDAVIAGSTLGPIARGVGRAVEAGLSARHGKRMHAALHGVHAGKPIGFVRGALTVGKPQLAREVLEGGVGGAAINAGREGLEIGRARRQAEAFIKSDHKKNHQEQKLAAGLDRSLPRLAKKLQPTPIRPLHPILDDEVEFEV